MRILYDYQIQICQRYGGVSRYFYEVISRIRNYPETIIDMPALLPKSYDLAEPLCGRRSINYPYKVAEVIYWFNRILIIPRLRWGKQDIIHMTQYRMRIPYHAKGKTVVTVHDMIWELFPQTDPSGRRRKQKKAAIDRADRIIAISETTKNDLLKFYPDIDCSKIKVIYHGVTTMREEYDGDICREKFGNSIILFIGARNAYKNFHIFLKAMKLLLIDYPEINIVCTGEKAFNTQENVWIQENGLKNHIMQSRCTDAELTYLYENALCFVFPSKYEGFGLPILEAFSKGCPTALSDTAIFREIAGEAAAYFDPDQEMNMAAAIRHILSDSDYRNELIRTAAKRTENFSWDHTAAEVYRVYQELI